MTQEASTQPDHVLGSAEVEYTFVSPSERVSRSLTLAEATIRVRDMPNSDPDGDVSIEIAATDVLLGLAVAVANVIKGYQDDEDTEGYVFDTKKEWEQVALAHEAVLMHVRRIIAEKEEGEGGE